MRIAILALILAGCQPSLHTGDYLRVGCAGFPADGGAGVNGFECAHPYTCVNPGGMGSWCGVTCLTAADCGGAGECRAWGCQWSCSASSPCPMGLRCSSGTCL